MRKVGASFVIVTLLEDTVKPSRLLVRRGERYGMNISISFIRAKP